LLLLLWNLWSDIVPINIFPIRISMKKFQEIKVGINCNFVGEKKILFNVIIIVVSYLLFMKSLLHTALDALCNTASSYCTCRFSRAVLGAWVSDRVSIGTRRYIELGAKTRFCHVQDGYLVISIGTDPDHGIMVHYQHTLHSLHGYNSFTHIPV